jgi:hypothetical protein
MGHTILQSCLSVTKITAFSKLGISLCVVPFIFFNLLNYRKVEYVVCTMQLKMWLENSPKPGEEKWIQILDKYNKLTHVHYMTSL